MTSAQTITLVVVIVAVLVVVGLALRYYARRRTLQSKFGPEYDRVVADQDSRAAAERELVDRERRHAELDIRPLDDSARARYATDWRAVQSQFVEDPAAAVVSGDEIVTKLVSQRGYPTDNYDEQLAYLSVEHARTLGHYRDAHEIYLRGQRGEASTEELRQALVHYRELFAEVLGDPSLALPDSDPPSPASAPAGVEAHETTQR